MPLGDTLTKSAKTKRNREDWEKNKVHVSLPTFSKETHSLTHHYVAPQSDLYISIS